MVTNDKSEKLIIRTTPRVYNEMHRLSDGGSLHDVLEELLEESERSELSGVFL